MPLDDIGIYVHIWSYYITQLIHISSLDGIGQITKVPINARMTSKV